MPAAEAREEEDMRPFATWTESALQLAAGQVARSASEKTAGFRTKWTLPPGPDSLLAYCEELRRLVEDLAREARRIEALADELRLRQHWRTIQGRR